MQLFSVTALVPTIDPPSAVVRKVEQVVARRRSREIEAVLPLPQTAAHRAGEAAKHQADGGCGMRWGSGGEGGRTAVLFSSWTVPRPTLTHTLCHHLGDLTLLV